MMKIFRNGLVIMLFLLVALPAVAEVTSSLWQTRKSQHFIVYYQESPTGFVDELIYRAEDYYNGIVDELGYRRFDFWSWDNRAKIYLYKDAADFQKETQNAHWTGAVVSVDTRIIKTFVGQEGFFDSLLPHEMTHIIFREFVGKNTALPLWIDEGVACSQEKSHLAGRLQIARDLVRRNEYIKLDKFSMIWNMDKVSPQVFYSEAASLIVFLMHRQGREGFLSFSRKLRDGVYWEKALLSTYRFASLEEMERAWKGFMLKEV